YYQSSSNINNIRQFFNQPINQSINQPINHSARLAVACLILIIKNFCQKLMKNVIEKINYIFSFEKAIQPLTVYKLKTQTDLPALYKLSKLKFPDVVDNETLSYN